jgi:hypothetical protein
MGQIEQLSSRGSEGALLDRIPKKKEPNFFLAPAG